MLALENPVAPTTHASDPSDHAAPAAARPGDARGEPQEASLAGRVRAAQRRPTGAGPGPPEAASIPGPEAQVQGANESWGPSNQIPATTPAGSLPDRHGLVQAAYASHEGLAPRIRAARRKQPQPATKERVTANPPSDGVLNADDPNR